MKTRFYALLTFILLLSVSCGRNKGMFILHGTVLDGSDSIIVVGFDDRYEDTDTLVCHNGEFTWKFRPDTVTTLILILPDGRYHPVFAQKDVESFITIPADTGLFSVSGGYCNDSYQSFYMASQEDTAMQQTVTRIDSFITRDPFSEVTPYIIYDRLVRHYHAKENIIEPLIKRMSGNMQDAPYLVSLKSEFSKQVSNNLYLDSYSVNDSSGHMHMFLDIGGTSNHLLVCVWASWMGKEGMEARDTLQYFLDKYRDRYFNVTDISVDPNVVRWKKAIEKDTVSWLSYNDPNGWESGLIKTAKFQTIPAFVLFTGVKRIVFRTESIQEMDEQLNTTLPKAQVKEDNKAKQTRIDKPKTKQIKIAQ